MKKSGANSERGTRVARGERGGEGLPITLKSSNCRNPRKEGGWGRWSQREARRRTQIVLNDDDL